MLKRRHRYRALRALLAMIVMSIGLVVFGPASPAGADPVCQDGGAYVLFVRGSGSPIYSNQAKAFHDNMYWALQQKGFSNIEWAEIGNLDKSKEPGEYVDSSSGKYPAVPVDLPNHTINMFNGEYSRSVTIGKNELVTHLNDRYAGDGPRGTGSCYNETLVLGGYSQGADVVGWALRSGELSQAAKDHIGFVALYGDPKFDPGQLGYRIYRIAFQDGWWWVRGNDAGFRHVGNAIIPDSGFLGARDPYVSNEFKGRFGSWCASGDAFCAGVLPAGQDIHSNKYQDYWIADSATEIAWAAKQKHDRLDAGVLNSYGIVQYTTAIPMLAAPLYYDDQMNPIAPPQPTITQVKRTADPDGIRQVYASTHSTVTEAYWIPGGDGVRTHKIIDIAQDNIVGFDKVNLPEGKQAVFTAVPDGVWESNWQSGVDVSSAKIITGLSGVRQVIADNRQETQGYTHRLYVLASDGPHEYWWRDGGDGIHHRLLNNISGAITMDKATGPGGEDQLYVATPTWAYELWWGGDSNVHYSPIINITQGDIRSIDKTENQPDGGQALITGTSTTAWQSYWNSSNGTPITHGTLATGQINAIQIKRSVTNGVYQLYLATGDHVQEYYWSATGNGGGELIRISQNNITSFDKSNDGAYQQVYTGTGNGDVWETWWGGGQGPTTKVLFSVTR